MEQYFKDSTEKVYRLLCKAVDFQAKKRLAILQDMGDGNRIVIPYEQGPNQKIAFNENGVFFSSITIKREEALRDGPIDLKPQFLFPDIEYVSKLPLLRSNKEGFSKAVSAMKSLLINKGIVKASLFDNLDNDDEIEREALNRISSYKRGEPIEDIFHLIQVWGGSSGRRVYNSMEGFEWNTISKPYNQLISSCLSINNTSDESIKVLSDAINLFDKTVKNLSVSFITKHVRFWLYHNLKENALPIYDSIMAVEVMHRSAPTLKTLSDYWKAMVSKAKRLEISLMALERQIFLYSINNR